MSSERLGVIGVGYVGLVTAACFARAGYDVVCLDIDEAKLERLRAGQTPIHEPGMEEALAGALERLVFTSSARELFAGADIAFVCVDTPPSASGDADLSRVESVLEAIPADTEDSLLVMKSTVPPGTGARLRRTLDERGLQGVAYASNPEFLREGSAIQDFQHPDRVVVGATTPTSASGSRPSTAPSARLRADHRRHLRGDDQARLERVPGDQDLLHQRDRERLRKRSARTSDPVARGMGLDARIGASFLRPGLGFGGSCFPKDVAALKQLAGNSGYHFEVNELQKRRAVAKLKAPPGLAARPGHFRALGTGLQARHRATYARPRASCWRRGSWPRARRSRAYDPIVSAQQAAAVLPRGIELAESALAAASGADAVVIVTEWPQVATPFAEGTLLPAMRTPL